MGTSAIDLLAQLPFDFVVVGVHRGIPFRHAASEIIKAHDSVIAGNRQAACFLIDGKPMKREPERMIKDDLTTREV